MFEWLKRLFFKKKTTVQRIRIQQSPLSLFNMNKALPTHLQLSALQLEQNQPDAFPDALTITVEDQNGKRKKEDEEQSQNLQRRFSQFNETLFTNTSVQTMEANGEKRILTNTPIVQQQTTTNHLQNTLDGFQSNASKKLKVEKRSHKSRVVRTCTITPRHSQSQQSHNSPISATTINSELPKATLTTSTSSDSMTTEASSTEQYSARPQYLWQPGSPGTALELMQDERRKLREEHLERRRKLKIGARLSVQAGAISPSVSPQVSREFPSALPSSVRSVASASSERSVSDQPQSQTSTQTESFPPLPGAVNAL